MDENTLDEKKKQQYGVGLTIILLLSVLTIGEFTFASVGTRLATVLLALSLIKAGLVIRDYMHIGRLFSEEE
jgi:cytochrome c oxidase subunit IV